MENEIHDVKNPSDEQEVNVQNSDDRDTKESSVLPLPDYDPSQAHSC